MIHKQKNTFTSSGSETHFSDDEELDFYLDTNVDLILCIFFVRSKKTLGTFRNDLDGGCKPWELGRKNMREIVIDS